MASLLRWKDKYVKERLQGLSCSSAAATSVVPSNGRAIDRHSPHLLDPHRRLPPPVPKPPRPSSSFSTTKDSSSSSYKQRQQICHFDVDGKDKRKNKKKKSTAAAAAGSGSSPSEHRRNGKEKALQLQQVSPASSSRFLLNSSRLMMQSDDETTAVDSLPPLPSPRRPSFVDAAAEDDTDTFPSSHGDAASPAVPSRRPQLVAPAPPLELFAEPSASGAGSSSSSSSEITGGHVVAAADNTVVVRSCSTRTGQHQVRTLRPSSIVHDHRSMHVLTINYRVERCQRAHR